ncbi:hypothetical protein WH47_02326 [Habropoda laboriosa]|uniref:Uncharacterized protein n=1 Tax=Habropoda laboriosa TaxID=597456 RepID=A0A0L7QZG1_9HYME|nr:PREDICTED: uncharacterized protein LOC108573583 [Habropoda laboriosa]KOC64005.1 hypothetical protein WH47_02326 [Habropoda laboriosa]
MRKQSYSTNLSTGSGGEPQIIVDESTLVEEEAEQRRNESPPRCLDPDSPSLNPYLLSPWRETRKHSLPTPQCTSGIIASQVRRLSERGGEGSGPSSREAAYLATLSQAPAPPPNGRRQSVVTISRVPPTLFGRNRRESIAAFPLGGGTRILANSTSQYSNSGSTHNLQLDIMDDIAEIKPRKVCLKMYKTSTEQVCEIQPLEGNSSTQRYTQYQKRRFSEPPPPSVSPTPSIRRRALEVPRAASSSVSGAAGIVCSNTDLISILSSLASSATEINRCGDDSLSSREDSKSSWSGKTVEQKRSRLKSFRSNSFDVSILHGAKSKLAGGLSSKSSIMVPSNWFTKRHQPMSKKQKPEDLITASLNFKFDKSKVVKVVKETLGRTSPTSDVRHKVVWDDTSGTKVDAQVLGTAIEKILTAQKGSDAESSGSTGKASVSPNKPRSSKVASWFSSGNKDQEQAESCEPSICSSLKDLFVK